MSKLIFVTREIPEIGIKMLRDKGYEVDVNTREEIPVQRQLISFLQRKKYDAVLCLLTDKIDAAVYDAAPTVKLYANYATGFDNIDIAEAKKRGIAVSNAPADLSAEAVAEHAVAMMFALGTRIVEADHFVRQGKYRGWEPMNFIGSDISGKTLGLVGAGHIGERVAYFCKGMDMKVIYYDVVRNERIEKECGAAYRGSPEEVLKEADVVSLHVPLLPTTHHLIDENRLKMMKPTAFLINTSRGPVVDELALEKALREKVIAGAALDVFEFEPAVTKSLFKLNNVILTPHIASASIEARDQMAEVAASNVIDFLEGKAPRNIVNA
jgi:lactate dehydrogenase-like 2-hydroxyacid dehydrogenase